MSLFLLTKICYKAYMKTCEQITVQGPVVHGAKRGRELGFPTANIELNEEYASKMPEIGIYAVWVKSNSPKINGICMGAASWGFNPTFGLTNPQLEVHILNFDNDIYGEELEVEFVEFIRGEINFACLESLVEKIQEDCEKTEEILNERHKVA
ncbi:MAG: hypothetical protein CMF61_07490 [Magnetococcales bacterium]|nr:hypothetical protein [Magnetococcales bacterium]